MSSYAQLPSGATLKPEKFTAHVSDEQLNDFKQLLKLSKIGPETYENLKEDRYFGVSRKWLAESKKYWETGYDWRKTEDRINKFPNFTVKVEDIDVHFLALFSKKQGAVPLLLLHGWPGSFLEFLSACEILTKKYTPDDLPFHVIVPSLPGYGYSSGPPLDRDYTVEDMSRVMDALMVGLGFGSGYVSQGGDIGSFITRVLGAKYDNCKAAHINLCIGVSPENASIDSLSDVEKRGVAKAQDFGTMGNSYAREHGQRPATIGLVLSSSPIALLAWIGEKFQSWTDTDPTQDEILDGATLYWFTDSFPRAIYPYRQFFGPKPTFFHNDPDFKITTKPFGYSYFPEELAPIPKSWVETTGNLTWYRQHTEGGHFAALEKPELFVKDMEDFIKDSWKN